MLCGSKSNHHVVVPKHRHLPQPESITLLLSEIGNFEKEMTVDSIVCNSCYLLCKRLLKQSGEDLRSADSIVESLKTELADLEEKVNHCVDSSELVLLQTALF